MLIQIPETGIIKKQAFDLSHDVSIIYGYNNSGKTTILKALDHVFRNRLLEQFILSKAGELAIYIPTNRVIVSENSTDELQLKDYEELIHYQQDSYKDYSLHLKRLRDQLLANKAIRDFIHCAIQMIFGMNITEGNRHSDGIENIINIYLNVVWAMVWDTDIPCLTSERFYGLLSQKKAYVMIDEIEMFLHVNIQSKLINRMKKDFANCSFILTTHSPLLLTRYKQCTIYNIENGRLNLIDDDMYYEDLDNIYEELFHVGELPTELKEGINYLGSAVLKDKEINPERINAIIEMLKKEYPNLYRRYIKVITKAQFYGGLND